MQQEEENADDDVLKRRRLKLRFGGLQSSTAVPGATCDSPPAQECREHNSCGFGAPASRAQGSEHDGRDAVWSSGCGFVFESRIEKTTAIM